MRFSFRKAKMGRRPSSGLPPPFPENGPSWALRGTICAHATSSKLFTEATTTFPTTTLGSVGDGLRRRLAAFIVQAHVGRPGSQRHVREQPPGMSPGRLQEAATLERATFRVAGRYFAAGPVAPRPTAT